MRKKVEDYAPSADEQLSRSAGTRPRARVTATRREASAVCVAADPLFRLERDCGAA